MSIDTTWHFFNSSHVFSFFFLIISCPMSAVRIFYSWYLKLLGLKPWRDHDLNMEFGSAEGASTRAFDGGWLRCGKG
jgi:hypothetical protein